MINFAKSKRFLIFFLRIKLLIKLLNFNQFFASNTDYIFFLRYVSEWHHLGSSNNFAMLRFKLGRVTAGIVKSFKELLKGL